jgi:hypothetical protein
MPTVIVLLVLAVLLGYLLNGYAPQLQAAMHIPSLPTTTSQTPPRPTEPTSPPAIAALKLGDTFVLGSIQYQVISISNLGNDLAANNPPNDDPTGTKFL